jgi:hypothetical protein
LAGGASRRFRPRLARVFLIVHSEDPVVIDRTLRTRLDYFEERESNRSWAWFVHTTRKISQHDFEILTRHSLEVS